MVLVWANEIKCLTDDYLPTAIKLELLMFQIIMLIQVPWIQVSRSRSLLLMVKPTVFLVAIGAGA